MKIVLLLLLFGFASCSRIEERKISCEIGKNTCPQGSTCSIKKNQGLCLKVDQNPQFKAILPFEDYQPVRCKAGFNSEDQFFVYDHNIFAIKFSGLKGLTALKVKAVAAGKAYIYDECPMRENISGDHARSNCGLGYGNHVRILHADGHMTVYGNLSEILIKHDQEIEKGQEIGIEGASGSASRRGLIFSVHKPWNAKILLSRPGQVGKSYPFKIFYRTATESAPTWRSSLELLCGSGVNIPFIYGGAK
jgi:hypothetical protein